MVMPAPEGYVVDLNNPERTGVPSVYYVAGFMGSLSLIFFAQRMYVKAVVATGIELDDSRFSNSKLFLLVLHLNPPPFPVATLQRRQMKHQSPSHRNLMIMCSNSVAVFLILAVVCLANPLCSLGQERLLLGYS